VTNPVSETQTGRGRSRGAETSGLRATRLPCPGAVSVHEQIPGGPGWLRGPTDRGHEGARGTVPEIRYRRIHAVLVVEGWRVNVKRIEHRNTEECSAGACRRERAERNDRSAGNRAEDREACSSRRQRIGSCPVQPRSSRTPL